MIKKHLLTAIFAVLVTVVHAQLSFGVDYFGIGELQTAKAFFEKQVSQYPAECNYYLGEIANAEGKTEEAKDFYAKGIAAVPTYMLNYIGQAKLILKTNQKAAEVAFATVLKKNKKDIALNIAIARAYFENGMKDLALARIELARKYNKKSPLIYTLEGDMLESEKKYGEAAGKYEQAIYFDPNFTVASIKCAQVYESINPVLSIEILKKVIANHPDYTIAYRNLGRTYTQSGQYQSSIEAFNIYFAEGKYKVDDITKFASAYFFTDQFTESIKLLDKGLQIEPDNFVLNRLRMYNASKTKDTLGMTIANHFFSLRTTNDTYIYKDYFAFGTILSDADQYARALEQFTKVIEMEGNRAEVYKEIAPVYSKMGENVKAAETYQKYIDMVGADTVVVSDYYQMGRAWYNAGLALVPDTTAEGKIKSKEYLVKADSAFSTVCRLSPESYIGYVWRANANFALDPETTLGLAKPFYETAISMILSKETNGNRNYLITAYRYLAYYYYLKDDKENCILNANKVLELDPANATAKQLLDSYLPVVPKKNTNKK